MKKKRNKNNGVSMNMNQSNMPPKSAHATFAERIEKAESAKTNWFVASTVKIAKSLRFFLFALLLIDTVYIGTCVLYGIDWMYFYVFSFIFLLEICSFILLSRRSFDVYKKGIFFLVDILFAIPLYVLWHEYNVHHFQLFLILAIIRLIMILLLIPVSLAKISYKSLSKKYTSKINDAGEEKYYYTPKKSFYRFLATALCTLFLLVSVGALVLVNAGSGNVLNLSRRVSYEYNDENLTCNVDNVLFGLTELEIPEECIRLNKQGIPTKYKVVGVNEYAFKNYNGKSVTLPQTVNDVNQLAFADSSVKEVTVLSSECYFNGGLLSGVEVLRLDNGLVQSDLNNETVNENISIYVNELNVNEYRQKYTSICDRFIPSIDESKLYVNFNNTSFDTLIGLKDENGQLTVEDPFDGTNDCVREENGREYQYVWWNKKTDGGIEKISFPYVTNESMNLYAHWVPVYNIDYVMDSNAQTDSDVNKFYFSMGSINLPSASLDGYTFMGWYLNEDFSGNKLLSLEDTTENDVTLYAKFLKNYNISYDFCYSTDDGGDYTKIYHRENENIVLPSPQRRGYTFGGWYEDNGFETKIDTVICNEERDISLYAKWDIINYSITYVDANVIDGINTNVLTYTVESDDIILDSSFTVPGYTFEGWYTDSSFENGSLVSTVAIPKNSIGDKTFFAKWTLNMPSIDSATGYNGVYDGESHQISVTPSHSAPDEKEITYKYKWFFNGTAVTENTDDAFYNVTNVPQSGIYTCYVTSYDGKYVSSPCVSSEISVDIQKADYDMSQILFENAEFTYDGKEHRPEISGVLPMGYDGITVTVTYDKNVINVLESGTVTTASFHTESENYNLPSPMTAKTSILPKEIVIDWCNDDFIYNGSVQNVTASYKDVNGTAVDLTVSVDKEFKNYDENGYTAEVSFKMDETNYALPSEFTKSYGIKKLSIENAEIKLGSSLIYNGNVQTQSIDSVTVNGLDVTYVSKNDSYKDASTYTLSVEGTGNFTGQASKDFTIAPKNISGAQILLGNGLVYNGSMQTQNVSGVTVDGLDVTYDVTNNTGTDAKTYILTVTGNGNFEGSVTKDFIISPKNISDATVTLGNALIYNGFAQEQTVDNVTVDGLNVTYDVSGNTGTDAKTYTLTVTAKGNFEGSITKDFTIDKKDVSNAVITLEGSLIYNGSMQTQNVSSVTVDGLTVTYDVTDNTGTDAKTYTLTVTGNGNFKGIANKDFTIAPKNISGANVTLGNALIYNGSVQEQTVDSVTVDGLNVTYDVSDNTGTDAKTYTLTVTGNGNFEGSVNKNFIIASKNISGAAITLGDCLVYNGKLQYQSVESVTVDGLTVTYTVIKNSGTDTGLFYDLVVEGNGNFTGQASTYFVIDKKDVSGATVNLGEALIYNGALQTQSVTSVTVDGLTVTYDVSDNTGTDAKTYTLTVTGNGNFKGSVKKDFTIAPKNISGAEIVLGSDLVYNGTLQTQSVISVTVDGLSVDNYTVKNNTGTDAKSYTLTVTPNGKNFTGSATKGFTIAQKDITNAEITLGVQLVYTGEIQSQTVTNVTVDGLTVTYEVSGNEGTDAGKYTLTVNGNGNFTGKATKEFTIASKDISGATVTLGEQLVYTGEIQYQTVTNVTVDGLTVTYEVSDNEGTDAGKYTLTVNGNGNFTGKATKEFTISPKDIATAEITLGEQLVYTGEIQYQTVTNVTVDGLTVTYEVSANEGTNAGKYTLTVNGNGNFTGKATKEFTIASKDISGATVTLGEQMEYNGKQQFVTVEKISLDGLDVDTYEIVSGNSGTEVGSYELNIKGTKNFTGEITVPWKIKPLNIENSTVKLAFTEKSYTGKEITNGIVSITAPNGVTISNKNYTADGLSATKAGTYTVTVTANGENVVGTVTATYEIKALNIADAEITLEADSFVYDGNDKTVVIKSITVGDISLVSGTDYSVVGDTNSEVGDYYITIVGSGNFYGEQSIKWTIAEETSEPSEPTNPEE